MKAHFQCAQSPMSLEFLGFHQSWASAVPNGHKSQTAASRSQAAKNKKMSGPFSSCDWLLSLLTASAVIWLIGWDFIFRRSNVQ